MWLLRNAPSESVRFSVSVIVVVLPPEVGMTSMKSRIRSASWPRNSPSVIPERPVIPPGATTGAPGSTS
jgi:hypothetical protein